MRALSFSGARIGEVKRVTKETNVSVKLNLDGSGVADSSTGIPFLDHMLDVSNFNFLVVPSCCCCFMFLVASFTFYAPLLLSALERDLKFQSLLTQYFFGSSQRHEQFRKISFVQ